MNEEYMKATYAGTNTRLAGREGEVTFDAANGWVFRPFGVSEWYRCKFDNLFFDRPEQDVAALKKKF